MSPKFNIDRPKISDEEINRHKDFNHLVEQFKQQSLKKARGDESWWQDKKIRYSTVIAGVTVICTVTYFSLFNTKQAKENKPHETLITQNKTTATTAPKAFINPPSQKLKINYASYKVNNTSGATITHTTSSKIKIPKNSFVDKNGRDVVGDVTIEYKEFHDIGDLIAGGIPMAYDSAGTKYNLETAGMFDIRGSQNGEPVFIKPDKNLEVELASRTSEDKFNQYYLDTLDKNWHYIQRDKTYNLGDTKHQTATPQKQSFEALAAKNPKLQGLKNDLEVVIPKKIDSVKIVYTSKAEKLPRAKEPAKPAKATGRPIFQLEASTGDFPELAAFDNVVFEVGAENKNYTNELQEITWSGVKVSQGTVKGKNYLLTLSYRGRTEKLIVYPVLTGASYEKAKGAYEEKLKTYEALVEKRQADEQRLMAEMEARQAAYIAQQKKKEDEYKAERARLQVQYELDQQKELAAGFSNMSSQVKAKRIFNVSKFGIYNSDCPHPVPQGVSVNPVFILNSKEKPLSPEAVYLIDHTAKTVYMRGQQDGFKLNYDPNSNYSICVFAGNRLFVCSKNVFRQAADNGSNSFVVTPLPDDADNLPDFKKALEI